MRRHPNWMDGALVTSSTVNGLLTSTASLALAFLLQNPLLELAGSRLVLFLTAARECLDGSQKVTDFVGHGAWRLLGPIQVQAQVRSRWGRPSELGWCRWSWALYMTHGTRLDGAKAHCTALLRSTEEGML